MPVLAHPGPSSPAPPAVRLEVDGPWTAAPAADALLRAEAPGSDGGTVSVVVRHYVGPADLGAGDLAEHLARRSSSTPGHDDPEVEEPFVVELGDRDWHARNVSWDEEGVPTVEVVLVTALGADDTASSHLVATGRVHGSGLEADYDTLQSVLETLAVGSER